MHTDRLWQQLKMLLVPSGRQHEQAQANFQEHRGPFPLHIYEHPQKSYTLSSQISYIQRHLLLAMVWKPAIAIFTAVKTWPSVLGRR